jgi:hypothetical protein
MSSLTPPERSPESVAATVPLWEAVIKVNVHDPEPRRARDIADGIGYAVCLLQDEYGWSATDIENAVQPHIDDAYDREEQRNG